MQSLEEILEAKTAASAPAQEAPQTSEEAPAAEAVETSPPETAEQQAGEQKDGAPPVPEPNLQEEVAKLRAFQKAAEDERKKRQEYERVVQELKAQNAEYQRYLEQARSQQNQQVPELLDPEGAQYLQGQFQTALQQQQAQLLEFKVVQSQEVMRGRHADYDEIEAVFAEAMQADPSLQAKLYAHPMPAQFAYQEGKKLKALQEIGSDPDAYRSKLAEEIKAQLMAEIKPQTPPAQTHTAPPPPPSLAAVPSATRPQTQWNGPTPLDDLLSQPLRRSR